MKVLLIVLGLLGSGWWAYGWIRQRPAWESTEAQTSYYGNGQPRSRVHYEDGRPEGPAEEWYPDGKPAAKGRYVAGVREGQWTFWSADGSLDAQRTGRYAQGRLVESAQESADS